MKKLLITRPNFDPGTSYLFEWSKEIIKEAEKHGINVIDVNGHKVNQASVLGRLESLKPEFVFLNGHGDEKTYFGHDYAEVINLTTARALKQTLTFIRACGCLEQLGNKAVQDGCKAFIGYSQDFLSPISDQYCATPLRDPIAEPVKRVSNEIMHTLLKGKTPPEAVDASRRLTQQYINKIMFSPQFAQDPRFNITLLALVNNDTNLGYVQQK